MSCAKKHIAIVGAGASGLFLAKMLSESPDVEVTVFEKNRQVGAKVRASGGGKANIFNRDVRSDHYNAPEFVTKLLAQYTPEQLDNQFAKWGLLTVSDEEGRVYPATQFSQTVVDVLCDVPANRVHFELNFEVQSIDYHNGKWLINDYSQAFNYLVLASGSPANIIPKNRKHYNDYLRGLKLKTNALEPSLVGFILQDYPKSLSGCRTKAIVSLFQGNKLIHKESGEITFKDDGISGIVIMNLSAYYRRLSSQKNCRLEINLIYWDEHFKVAPYLSENKNVIGILHPKLSDLYQQKPFDIQRLTFQIEDTYPMEGAQVCHGGIDLSEVNEHFKAKNVQNLYLLGEILDVDGICGGYNLFFAFASAAVVGAELLQ